MKIRNLIVSLAVMLMFGCAATLNQQGEKVRLVDRQTDYQCTFVGTVTGSNSMGNTTAHDAEGAINELRNKAAQQGANAVRVINIDSTAMQTTAVGEALNCQF